MRKTCRAGRWLPPRAFLAFNHSCFSSGLENPFLFGRTGGGDINGVVVFTRRGTGWENGGDEIGVGSTGGTCRDERSNRSSCADQIPAEDKYLASGIHLSVASQCCGPAFEQQRVGFSRKCLRSIPEGELVPCQVSDNNPYQCTKIPTTGPTRTTWYSGTIPGGATGSTRSAGTGATTEDVFGPVG